MKATYIDYKETNSFSPAVIRYLEKDPQLQSFISHFPTPEGFQKILKERKVTADRQALAEVLKEQYAPLAAVEPLNPAVVSNIDLLISQNTFTVTTGHQLNIFTGPLYFIFKIVTAIKLASELKTLFPEKTFVPVYWMATEDHDFAEINHTRISGKTVSWDEPATGATGRLAVKGILKALQEYKAILGLGDSAEQLAAMVESAYTSHQTLAQATRHLVNTLFGKYGLLIIDADHPKLKKQFARIIEEDIFNESSYKNIEASIQKLQEIGIEAQVNPREINFFYLRDQLRERLVYQNNRYEVLNSNLSFDRKELESEIRQYPERFSPNVVMRPLYQEVILPNLAYIGGGAEMVYWLELKKNFDHFGIDFPILVLRNSSLIATEDLQSRLNRLCLTYPDLFLGIEDLKKKWVLANSTRDLQVQEEWEEFERTFETLKAKAGRIDKTLQPSTEAIRTRLRKALDNLEKKFLRAEKRNQAHSLNQLESLKRKHFPNGLQERSENFGSIYARQGEAFLDALIKTFHPLDFKFTIVEFDEKN